MARKLKTYQTSLGFFDLAIAAPSMKAALEAWGAEQTRDLLRRVGQCGDQSRRLHFSRTARDACTAPSALRCNAEHLDWSWPPQRMQSKKAHELLAELA